MANPTVNRNLMANPNLIVNLSLTDNPSINSTSTSPTHSSSLTASRSLTATPKLSHTATPRLSPTPSPVSSTGQRDVEGSFKCVFCDVNYKVERYYNQHVGNHVPCKYEGCDWECTPKLMVDHVRSAHLGLPPSSAPKADGRLPSGYSGVGFKEVDVVVQGRSVGKFTIPLGDDPEDTRKWLEERRKRFPTRKNIAAKAEKEALTLASDASAVDSNGFWDVGSGVGSFGGPSSPLPRDPVAYKLTKAGQFGKLCRHYMGGKGCRKGGECGDVHDETARGALMDRRKAQGNNKRVMEETFGKEVGGRNKKTKGVLEKLLEGEQRREKELTLAAIRYLVEVNFYQSGKK
ncbi:hypothetical protein TrRE_jg7541 [Triparma retinervis]|uniref:C3H1-type domain-containing protein n=1 Tax=Triparma retinervis TaxID=2557542 RepID=A0A9W7AFJ6_9STRA|nr:hypothetical protein TrRE_jg7541 [Triparma retinervis]